MILLILFVEEDKFIPEFKPPRIKIEEIYFKRERIFEFEIGLDNKFDILSFFRYNENYLYGTYIRKNMLNFRFRYNYEKIYGKFNIIGETMNPYFSFNNKLIITNKIPVVSETNIYGLKDSLILSTIVDIIVPYETFFLGFTGGYKNSILTGIFYQGDGKRITVGKDMFEILFFSDIFFLSLKYCYDNIPFYNYFYKTDYHFYQAILLEFLYGSYFLKAGFIRGKFLCYLNFNNSEIFLYEKKIGFSIYYTIIHRYFKTRFVLDGIADIDWIDGQFGTFIIPQKDMLPFFGVLYKHKDYWRIFAGIKFK